MFQSPISGVNDWNTRLNIAGYWGRSCFSLLLAELMIGTTAVIASSMMLQLSFQSPISGVNDWNVAGGPCARLGSIRFSLLLAELMIGTRAPLVFS